MTSVVIVDWLGRGGIAQTTQEWAAALGGTDHEVAVVTRGGRELAGLAAPNASGRIRAHRAVASYAAQVIDERQPDVVVVQNYVIPPLEHAVYVAAARVGARVVVAIHDHRLHSLAAGNRLGLRRALRRADAVIAHSRYVADAVAAWTGRAVTPLPLPIFHALVDAPAPAHPPFVRDADRRLAVHFGILKRGYKGTQTILDAAAQRPPGWRFGFLGVGSPAATTGVEVVSGYVDNDVLAAAVRASDATLLPYRIATQSGAVVVAQALGSVPVASAVGGIPEQIEHGTTGLLLAPNATTNGWLDALEMLRDDRRRCAMAAKARIHVQEQHDVFVAGVRKLVGGG